MNRSIFWMAVCGLAFALACGGDEAKNAADDMKKAGNDAAAAAQNMANKAGQSAQDAAGSAANAATNAAGAVATSAVDACRSLAEQGDWGKALEVCKKAHEMLPDDLALEHAYQQAKAASN